MKLIDDDLCVANWIRIKLIGFSSVLIDKINDVFQVFL